MPPYDSHILAEHLQLHDESIFLQYFDWWVIGRWVLDFLYCFDNVKKLWYFILLRDTFNNV